MKAKDADILILPGLGGGTPDHWYNRWAEKIGTARRVEQPDFDHPDRAVWSKNIKAAVEAATRPVVLVAHSAGVAAAAHAAPDLPPGRVSAAFLVGMPDIATAKSLFPAASVFDPLPREPLPFPSMLIASQTDPYCAYDIAEDFGAAWGSVVVDAGDAGHLNNESGHGPWPEGLMRFAQFLGRF